MLFLKTIWALQLTKILNDGIWNAKSGLIGSLYMREYNLSRLEKTYRMQALMTISLKKRLSSVGHFIRRDIECNHSSSVSIRLSYTMRIRRLFSTIQHADRPNMYIIIFKLPFLFISYHIILFVCPLLFLQILMTSITKQASLKILTFLLRQTIFYLLSILYSCRAYEYQ